MTRPTVTAAADELYDGLGPWTQPDEHAGWPLLLLCEAIARPLHAINQLAQDHDDRPGWADIVDVDAVPIEGLPWLAQFAGATLAGDYSPSDKRAVIKDAPGFRRGTLGALVAAAKPFLTGQRTVKVYERDTSPYHFRVVTLTSETLNEAGARAAMLAVKPAGLIMDYDVQDGLSYDEIAFSAKTYDELDALFDTSDEMKYSTTI